MTAATQTRTTIGTDLSSIALIALIGATLVFLTGFAHSDVLHDSAHDVRHAIGFACH